MKSKNTRTLLIIMDGFGKGKSGTGNAIELAKMQYWQRLLKRYPSCLLKASGNAVGLPKGYQGNSEVGHFTIGAGRITWQSLEEIDRSIKNKSFFQKKMFIKACQRVRIANQKGEKRALHLLGMISDEGVHAHLNHLFALIELAKKEKAFPIYIHAILDGRDVPERSAPIYLQKIQNKIKQLELEEACAYKGHPQKAQIGTIIGRYYAMDRDTNWDRTQVAYDLMVHGKGIMGKNPLSAIKNAYKNGAKTDYYVEPIILNSSGLIKKQDSVIFFNYRTDRAQQLTDAFVNKKFDHFKTNHQPIYFAAMGPYTTLAPVAFPTPIIKKNLGEILAQNQVTQIRMAETEKYAHVTFFFNSQKHDSNPLEKRLMVHSPKCPSYAEKPEMSARELTAKAILELKRKKYGFAALNYANADLVGHSGNLKAAIQCCKVLDECLAKIVPAALESGYAILLVSDHGNVEQMKYPDGSPCPSHTTNPVLAVLISRDASSYKLKKGGGLQDIAPTILQLLGISKPKVMTGESLLKMIPSHPGGHRPTLA